MDRYPAHKLASICQRMPLDVYVMHGETAVRVVKSDFVKTLKSLDGRSAMKASLTLQGIYVRF